MKLASKILVAVAGILLLITIKVPIWRIDLVAPQYPEGLYMLIYADRIGGDVDIINGLNHYIGMKTIHYDEFWEFSFLPYIIGGFGILALIIAFFGGRKLVMTLLILFGLFGTLAMYDFWRWEYDYGHNLDPTAAIIVPGMSYQPPLIGFKQLLNFGAYSFPDLGGWFMVVAGLFMVTACAIEFGWIKRFARKGAAAAVVIFGIAALLSCSSQKGPAPIKINSDACDHCKMTIAEPHFAAELISSKGKVFKFDDLDCLLRFEKEKQLKNHRGVYVHDYTKNNVLIDATSAWFFKSEELKSPMRGNIAAFGSEQQAKEYAKKYRTEVLRWQDIIR